MTNRFSITELEAFPGVTEIVAHGRVRANLGMGVEAQVEVAVELDAGAGTNPARSKRVWLGVGQLGLVPSGRRFRNGRPSGWRSTFRMAGSVQRVPRREEVLGAGRADLGRSSFPSSSVAGATGWLLEFEGSGSSDDARDLPQLVFLPALELVRALFGSSSVMLKQAFDGLRDATMFPDRFAWDRSRSRVDDDGSVVIHADSDMANADIRVVALLVADQSKRLLGFHDQIHQRLAQDPDFRGPGGAYLELPWPWADGVGLSFVGRWIERRGISASQERRGKRFVITRILGIDPPCRPSAIHFHFPLQTVHDGEMPASDSRTIASRVGTRRLATGREPDALRRPATIETDGAEIWGAGAAPITKHQGVVVRAPRDAGLISDPVEGDILLSSDDARYHADHSIGRVHIRAAEAIDGRDRSDAEARRRTWEALDTVVRRHGWTITYWAAANGVDEVDFAPARPGDDVPMVAVVDAGATGLRAVADAGSSDDAPVSLGVLALSGASARQLADRVYGEAKRRGWRWIERRRPMRTRSPGAHGAAGSSAVLEVTGHRRPRSCWEDEEHYAALLERWLL